MTNGNKWQGVSSVHSQESTIVKSNGHGIIIISNFGRETFQWNHIVERFRSCASATHPADQSRCLWT